MMIWLRVKVNGTRLCTAVHFTRNKIKYQKSREKGTFPVQTLRIYDSLFVIYIALEVLQMLPLAAPFIEIGGKQKITIASICDKKETL